jgi:hypothetical protein
MTETSSAGAKQKLPESVWLRLDQIRSLDDVQWLEGVTSPPDWERAPAANGCSTMYATTPPPTGAGQTRQWSHSTETSNGSTISIAFTDVNEAVVRYADEATARQALEAVRADGVAPKCVYGSTATYQLSAVQGISTQSAVSLVLTTHPVTTGANRVTDSVTHEYALRKGTTVAFVWTSVEPINVDDQGVLDDIAAHLS